MFDWLKRLFGSTQGPAKIADLEARLVAPGGGDVHAEVEYEAYADGYWQLDIELEHPGIDLVGPLEVRFNGIAVGELTPQAGAAETELHMRAGEAPLAVVPEPGMVAEIHGAGGVIATGSFHTDR